MVKHHDKKINMLEEESDKREEIVKYQDMKINHNVADDIIQYHNTKNTQNIDAMAIIL